MNYSHRVTVYRFTRAEQDGEIVPTEAEHATGVKLRIEEEHGRVFLDQSGVTEEFHAIALIPFNTDIQPDQGENYDEIVQTTPNSGKRWKVLTIADESGTSHHLVAKLQSVQA